MHTGGDLSLPAEVRAMVQPKPLPVYHDYFASDHASPPTRGAAESTVSLSRERS